MFTAAENELLTRTGPRTAMGEYFRRFWLPVALSRELPAPDSPPIRVRVLGEPFIAFRDSAGAVGLVEPRCAHRGADLFFGRNEEGGLRCIYHGWKYDVGGRCLELPNVPAGSAYHGKIAIRACPTREFGELVWAYLGPADREPPDLPQLEFGLVPPSHRYVTKRLQQCNWAQSMEGALDTAHFSFLHMPAPGMKANENPQAAADERRIRWLRHDPLPQFTILDHEVGFAIGGSRKADGGELYWRATQFMLPSHSITPSAMPGETYYGYTWVPVDDESCWIYVYAWHPERPLGAEERARYDKGGYGQFAELGPGYVPLRNRTNDYLIDREEQKHRSFTGVRGIAEQDAMAQDSQGLIADRTSEHLSATDIAIVRFRQAMLQGARALAEGTEPQAPRRAAAYRLRAGGALAPAELPFEEVMRRRFGTAAGRVP
ncbi:MAG: Rieske 2Fe-2S domain-containing protein [Betaproteobacteria bacterium]|nr:Rieske 2Fe-2S domain-containing protein [Betaproteobacteria bacterium]